jgi:hypothetical protein
LPRLVDHLLLLPLRLAASAATTLLLAAHALLDLLLLPACKLLQAPGNLILLLILGRLLLALDGLVLILHLIELKLEKVCQILSALAAAAATLPASLGNLNVAKDRFGP